MVGTDNTPELVIGPHVDMDSFILGLVIGLGFAFIIWSVTWLFKGTKSHEEDNEENDDE